MNSSNTKVKKLEEELVKCQHQVKNYEKESTSVAKMKAKLTEKTKELNLNKEQIDALENHIGELKEINEKCQRQLDVKSAECEKSGEINLMLTRSLEKGSGSTPTLKPGSAENTPYVPKQPYATGEAPKQNESQKRKERVLCFHEVVDEGSCPFAAQCMFSHKVAESDRKNKTLFKEAEQKKSKYLTRYKQRETKTRENADELGDEICEVAFWNGSNNSCQCSKKHNLDFERLQRGPCQMYILGVCHRGKKCWFSHEIPKSVKEDQATVEKAKMFAAGRRKNHDNKSCDYGKTDRSENMKNNPEINNERAANTMGILSPQRDQNEPNQTPNCRTYHHEEQCKQPNLSTPMHDPFLLLVRNMIQDQIQQAMMSQPHPTMYPPQPIHYFQNQIPHM